MKFIEDNKINRDKIRNIKSYIATLKEARIKRSELTFQTSGFVSAEMLSISKIGEAEGLEFQMEVIDILLEEGAKLQTIFYSSTKDVMYFRLSIYDNDKEIINLGLGHISKRKKVEKRGWAGIGQMMVQNMKDSNEYFDTFAQSTKCLLWFKSTYNDVWNSVINEKEDLSTNQRKELKLA